MKQEIFEALEKNPIIAAAKDEDQLKKCLSSPCEIVVLLFGDICNVSRLVQEIKAAGKYVIVHADLINGLSQKEIVADYLQQYAHVDGLISTRPNLTRRAKAIGLFSVLRIFAIDSMALNSLCRMKPSDIADVIELLPGVIPKVISSVWEATHLPLIVGGLIEDKKDVMAALSAGAIGVSTSSATLWHA